MDSKEIRRLLHDLNNALNAAKIHAYLLRQDSPDSKQTETLDGLEAALESARVLIANAYEKVPRDTESH